MTRCHFEAIAEALRDERPQPAWDANKHAQWNLDVRAVTAALKRTCPNFDRDRFLDACLKEGR